MKKIILVALGIWIACSAFPSCSMNTSDDDEVATVEEPKEDVNPPAEEPPAEEEPKEEPPKEEPKPVKEPTINWEATFYLIGERLVDLACKEYGYEVLDCNGYEQLYLGERYYYKEIKGFKYHITSKVLKDTNGKSHWIRVYTANYTEENLELICNFLYERLGIPKEKLIIYNR